MDSAGRQAVLRNHRAVTINRRSRCLQFRPAIFSTLLNLDFSFSTTLNKHIAVDSGVDTLLGPGGQGSLKLRLGAFFICLLLSLAAVDTIPDPYALNPPTKHGSAVVADQARPATPTAVHLRWGVAAEISQLYPMNWFSRRFAFDLLPKGDLPLPRVQHAADSSPPFVS